MNEIASYTRNLSVSNNLLIASGACEHTSYTPLAVSILNLDHVPLSIPESPEQRRLRSLFMNEEESDVKLKVQDQIIPAHKQVLVEKSKYFANLFNSGMTEPRQKFIEIPDCDYLTLKEFLRFLYCDEVQLDAIISSKLLAFAEKNVLNDVIAKCMYVLNYDINPGNVFKILDFARRENMSHLRTWCQIFLKDKIDSSSISGFVEYVNKQNNSEFAQENVLLRDQAISAVINNYSEISQNQNVLFYEDFLIKNIGLDTILTLVNFVCGLAVESPTTIGVLKREKQTIMKMEDEREIIELHTANLRDALYNFVWKNVQKLTENDIMKEIPHEFLVGLVRKMAIAQDQDTKNLQTDQQTSQ